MAVAVTALKERSIGPRISAHGMIVQAVAVLVGFLVNQHIFNADNYLYLVLL
jgi:hypothetical protein